MKRKPLIAILLASLLALALNAQVVETVTTNGLSEPYGVVVPSFTNLYFYTSAANGDVKQYDPVTQQETTLAGFLASPQGIVAARGGLVIAEAGSHEISFVGFDGSYAVLAGGTRGFKDGVGTAAQFSTPSGLAVDAAGNIYIADLKNSAIRRLAPDNTVTTVATGFFEPAGVAIDGAGRLIVADTRNHVIRLVNPDGSNTIIAGRENVAGYADGGAGLLDGPRGLLWVGGDTGLLVADSGNNIIRRLSVKRGAWSIDTYAGKGEIPGYVEGALTAARFNSPIGMAVDQTGAVLVADLFNNALRRIQRAALPPVSILPIGGSFSNTVAITITNAVTNAVFYFTTDGTDPVFTSPVAHGKLTLTGGPVPLQIRAVSPDYAASLILSNYYSFFVNPLSVSTSGGSFINETNVTISTLTSNTVVRYTTDGSTPTTNSPVWVNGSYAVNGPLQVQGFRDGFTPSEVVSNFFTFTVATPTIDPPGAADNNPVQITLSTETRNASIYWTIDGSEPSAATGRLYTGPFSLGTNGTLKVKAIKPGFLDSAVASQVFNLSVASPLIVPGGAITNNTVAVTLITGTQGADLFWTIDGSVPSRTNGVRYTGSPFVLGTNGLLQVRGFRNGFVDSPVVAAQFSLAVADPVINPAGAVTNNTVPVTITSATIGAEIYWTIDGSDPSRTNGLRYTGSFTLGTNGVLRARAFKDGFVDSQFASALFSLAVADPVIIPAGIATNNNVTVKFTTATQGADIYWTIDGTTPSRTNGTLYTTPFALGTNGLLQVRAVKNGFLDSQVINASFTLTVSDLAISPPGGASNNNITVTLDSDTVGADFYWTIDGSTPSLTNGVHYTGPFALGTNGVLLVRGFKNGYLPSAIFGAEFNLTAATPTITPSTATSDNAVLITLGSATKDAQIYWTIDGSDPTTASAQYTGPFALGTNGVLKARAYKNGYAESGVASGEFNLIAAAPVFTPGPGTTVNTVTVTAASATTNATLRYTVDGSDPVAASASYGAGLTFTTNTTLKMAAFRGGFTASPVTTAEYFIQVDTPKILLPDGLPLSGFFPNGLKVKFSVDRADAVIYYTLDGSVPTTNSTLYVKDSVVNVNELTAPGRDLTALRVRAFAPNTVPSAIAEGQPIPANTAGIPRDVEAGIGSTVVVPIVVNLRTNQALKSIQLRVEVAPATGAPNLETALRAQAYSGDDFVPLLAPVAGGDGARILSIGDYQENGPGGVVTNGMIITALGTNANFAIAEYGVVAIIAVPIPRAAKVGDRYSIAVISPSGTADGQQGVITLGTLAAKTITIKNYSYLVGDTAPGGWYNAGDFGSGVLDNGDVNNAFYASLGIRVPYNFTDAFDAMDAFPLDEEGIAGGDGEIRFLDWQVILLRSLNRDTNRWYRSWSVGGNRIASRVATQPVALARRNSVAKTAVSTAVWERQAMVSAGNVGGAQPGQTVSVPVYVNIAGGDSLAGLQFRARVEGDAPALESQVLFVPASGLPAPVAADGAALNEATAAWGLQLNPFKPALTGSNLLGTVRFVIPAGAQAGQSYSVRLFNADGAPDLATPYDFETQAGSVWVQVPAAATASVTSDEWKIHFFGSVTSPDAGDDADPDQDGMPNWLEYRSGTSPVISGSRLSLLSPEWNSQRTGIVIRWEAAPGKLYTVEGASGLGGSWQVLATDIAGSGGLAEYLETNLTRNTMFYRVRVQP